MATCWLLRNNYDLYKFLTSQQIAKSHLIWLIYFHYKKIGPLKHINSSPNLLIIIPEAAWRRVESRISKKGEPPLESRVPPWYEIKTYTRDISWQKFRSHFSWYQQKLKNDVINQLFLSRRLTGESLKLIQPLDSEIWHGPYFSLQILFSKFWPS